MGRLTFLFALCALLFSRGVAAGQCSPCTIWNSSTTPAQVDSGDNSSVEVGVKFRADVAGYVSGVRFYKSVNNVGTHIGNLWNSSGVLLASAQFSGETGSGWQQVNFGTPVLISANTTYVVSYFAPQGRYSFDVGYFSSTGADNAPLHALATGVDGPNAVYNYGPSSSFPGSSYNATNYWVDVVFVPQGSTVAPTVTSTSPAAASGGFVVTSSLSATFSAVMDPTTMTPANFQLFDPSNTAIPGSVTYFPGTSTATFQPGIALAYQTTYTAVIRGTTRDFLGNSLGSDFSWTFATGNGPSNAVCPCTIWPSNSAPSLPDSGDGSSIEVGVKFKVDVSGFITGVRFYKSAANTGTHIGNLWTAGGNLLASVTFTGETASGWQQATFASPILVTPGNTYLASYFAPNGHYAWDEYYLTNSVDNVPLHALSSGSSGGNGVYVLTAQSTFPSTSYDASNYAVDVSYLLQNSTTPPVVLSTTPGGGTTGASLGGLISVQFSEPMDPSTFTSNAFQLLDSSNNVIQGTIGYVPATASLTFQPSLSLTPQTVYTATVTQTVHDALGNALVNNYTWSFTTAPPPADSGPGGPILVIASSINPFSRYLGEILLNEGLNEFLIKDITTVTPTVLGQYDVAILGDFPLTSAQASMLNTWVGNGGSLIAMHPDQQLAGMLGISPTGETLSNQYMLVNTASAPGAGIYSQAMQFHGTADLYTLNGATALATLYSNQSTATTSPAVTLANSGAGQAAAFTYDLSRSVVYTRQGNPAWSGEDRDQYVDPGTGLTEIRSNDLYYGNASFDPEPDWVNLNNVQVPQADEQQRLFTNLIQLMNARRKPLPRFWYLPDGYEAAVIMTGDDHGGNGTQPRFDIYVSESPANCSLADWTCVRATSYVFPANVTFNPPTSYSSYIAEGFEVANHSDNDPTCTTFTPSSLSDSIVASQGRMTQYFPQAPTSQTNRTHCVLWSDYDSEPGILLSHGIRLDTSYYYWPDIWVQDRPGLFTGSGFPMRYSDRNGNTINVYQAATQFPDETTWTYPNDIDTVLANAVGPNGFYAVFTANMHTDNPQEDGSDIIVTEAKSYGVPVIAATQMLTWLDGRNNSTFSAMSWSGNVLSFTVNAATGSHGLEVMIPTTASWGPLFGITLSGADVKYQVQTIKGLPYAIFLTTGGTYQATYGTFYSVSGTISGTGGKTATVKLSGSATATTTTNASGSYTFTGLPNGAYTVTPSKTGYAFTPASQAAPVSGANVTGVNFASGAATFSISGTITGAGGVGATVTLSGAGTETTTADSSGNYTISGVSNGNYTVTPTNPGFTFTPVNRAKTVTNANVTAVNFSAPGAPAAQLSPTTWTFPSQTVGVTSSAQTITLTNTGNASMTISSINVTGTNPTNFAQTNNCGTALAAGSSCTVNVTFTPSANGAKSAKLSVADNAPKSPQTVTLSGTGATPPSAQLSTAAFNFGTVADFAASAPQSVTLKNTGTAAMQITSITIGGTNAGDFVISSNACGATLAAAGTCIVKVEFTPQAEGARSAQLIFSDSAPASPQTIPLTGTGTLAKITPVTLSYTALKVGGTSVAKTVTIKNVGPDVLSFSSIALTGANPGDFTETTTCGTSLAMNGSCTVAVRFVPTATGSRTATLSISDSDPTSPQLVTLTGTGQ